MKRIFQDLNMIEKKSLQGVTGWWDDIIQLESCAMPARSCAEQRKSGAILGRSCAAQHKSGAIPGRSCATEQ